jgi:hypothetical protein
MPAAMNPYWIARPGKWLLEYPKFGCLPQMALAE